MLTRSKQGWNALHLLFHKNRACATWARAGETRGERGAAALPGPGAGLPLAALKRFVSLGGDHVL